MSNTLKEMLYEAIDKDKGELFEILSSLIQINSENFGSYGNEAACAEFIADYFNKLGHEGDVYSPLEIDNIRQHPDYFDGRNLENRKNCSVIVKGKTNTKRLMLAAHIDTVEIGALSEWECPPLSGEIKDGKIHGRGACDDKYGIAISMFLIKKMKELGLELDYDLIFSAFCDEEYGGSNGALAACLKYPCDDCLVLDCRENELWDSGCGGGVYSFKVSSKESTDNCTNVLNGMNLLIEKLGRFEKRRKAELEAIPEFSGSVVAKRPMRIMDFSVGENGGVNMDKGQFSVTLYTSKKEEEIIDEFRKVFLSVEKKFEKMGLNKPELQRTTRFFHYVESNGETEMIKTLLNLSRENGVSMKRCGACLSDLPMFKIYGSHRAVAMGMGASFSRKGGSHQANEYIECDKVVKLAKIVAGFIAEYK